MIDVIGLFDNEDGSLGLFFHLCYENLVSYLEKNPINISYFNSPRLNGISISLITDSLGKFITLAYSHGSETELLRENIPYVSTEVNIDKFSGSFFYTCSCHTGKILGKELVNNGVLNYIGYSDKFKVWGFNMDPYIDCANYGIKLFFEQKCTNDIIYLMKEKYNEYIDNYENDIFGAAMLVSNRNSLVSFGNNISIDDLS
ncbi:hypothetical protein R5N98_01355 [Tenacibaculum maritimum]|uniref:hypothetical protein n=1 Tax=Tenacibaculum maritimum TaxID=107401 RepID=UPI0003FC4C15|nr:hypothetical protein [Tenacibaculum maritimum]MCD9580470.1 hypothetical protein [Tenacibaculum maritimum]MCD9634900.1 hypothetical protein [Tenacibaculum maritimum]CAA0180617.1 conserved hypothetical protein [Tenacibaculum maritimum]CAA0252707.1 conserved hypothetical protein [Tenacibaculum maritimum]